MEAQSIIEGSPLLEREGELQALLAAIETAGRGEGTLALINGAAGTGKSTLLGVTLDEAREHGARVARARGSELEQELAYGVIRQLFDLLLRAASAARRARLLSGAAAAVARLFQDVGPDLSSGGDGGFATLHGLYWLAAGLARDRPLVLGVDDLHWVDAPSLRALHYLATRVRELPIALVLTRRPHEPTSVAGLVDEIEAHPEALRIGLSALGSQGSAVVVRGVYPLADDELCGAFHTASAGNPFLLRELLRSVAPADGTVPRATKVRDAAVASVGERVLGRVKAIGPAAPRLAAAMSVLGTGGRLEHAAAVAQLELPEAAAAALRMRRVEILSDEDPFEWVHPLVRHSIYDSLTLTERDVLHGRAAKVLARSDAPASMIGVHLAVLRPAGSTEVVTGLLAAIDEALARDAPEVAVTLLRRALQEGADDPPRPTLLLKLGQIEVTRRNPEAIEILREAGRLSPDQRERAVGAIALGEILVNTGQFRAAAEVSLDALAHYDGADPDLSLELEAARAVILAFDPALVAELWPERERLLLLTRGSSWGAHALAALLALTSALRGEPPQDVLLYCDRALVGGRLFSERGAGAWASAHVLGALCAVEAYERLAVVTDELQEAASRQGSVANALVAEGTRGWVAARRGDLARAEENLRPMVEVARKGGMLLYLVTALWWMVDVICERPSSDDLAGLTESLELPPALREVAGGGWPLLARGRIRAARGDRGGAAEDLRAGGRIFDALGFGPVHDPWRCALALVLPRAERDEARALVDEELALADAAGLARPRGIALRAAGLLTGGDAGIQMLEASAELLAGSPARYEQALSLVELGAALRRTRRRADARQPLEVGMEIAHTCGATRLVGRAREELLATGARPRRIARSGFESLTASERRIVRLAAEGHSNPEIAQSLYVSVKTVETHLSNAYTKLALSGPGARRRLAAVTA